MARQRRGAPDRSGEERVLEFMRLMWAVDHQLQAASKRMHSSLGVTAPQRLAIRMIGRTPGLSAGELALALHLHPSTVTGVLDRLERGGLIARTTDPGDARRARLRLAPRGQRLNRISFGTVEHAVARALAGLPASRISAARAVLEALSSSLEHTHPPERSPGRGRSVTSDRPPKARHPGRRSRKRSG
jgi:DNA-binding MarR family transcriptional regulator